MNFEVILDKRALEDIQDAYNYYLKISLKIAEKYVSELEKYIDALSKNPFYQVRYENIRCLPLKKFPFMIHFSVDEEKHIVKVHAVLHTSQNPDKWIDK